ncbi:hypothetical protein EHF33_04820 [Deinococcus psychrotolerans]|uniref:DUF4279 domain-containing protein n=1 Tax=Deinococcus psychrotolerans TaxID=2489213 RepID=A0A3G8YKS2_9DEIO|nr:DUF4279 domain-containing protein [Deinococcus psychrotolerans]AZI42151.1 hypothetical protein EHF33_04820 [Deinococcus psychrotolerans]
MTVYFMVRGYQFDPDHFLERSGLTHPTMHIWRKGQKSLPSGRIFEFSGLSLEASEAHNESFNDQVINTVAFLKEQSKALSHLLTLNQDISTVFEFCIEDRDVRLQTENLPPELLRLAGNLNIGIDVTRSS